MNKTFEVELSGAGVELLLALLKGVIGQYGDDIEEASKDSAGDSGHSWVCYIEQMESEREACRELRASIKRQVRLQHMRN